MLSEIPKKYWPVAGVALVVLGAFVLFWELGPISYGASPSVAFKVEAGQGVSDIAGQLVEQGLIRSRLAFEVFSVLDGTASSLKPGVYKLSPAMSVPAITRLIASATGDITVTVPEGANKFQIDKILSDALVLQKGEFREAASPELEGLLFPDTYRFTGGVSASSVVQVFLDNFNAKAQPLFAHSRASETSTLTLASILEKEAQSPADQRLIAGILLKRLRAGMPLDVDATVCYAKQLAEPETVTDCAKLTAADMHVNSPYNTYLAQGLPPSPIGNPGLSSISAAQNPTASPYWYYLSDPQTGKIIYAKTLGEQEGDIDRYLK